MLLFLQLFSSASLKVSDLICTNLVSFIGMRVWGQAISTLNEWLSLPLLESESDFLAKISLSDDIIFFQSPTVWGQFGLESKLWTSWFQPIVLNNMGLDR